MRVEPYSVGSYLHIVKRGARGLNIVRDESDRWRFLRMLFLLNDKHFSKNWIYEDHRHVFSRPSSWPDREPLVEVLGYTLMPNHFHLLIQEISEGGVSLFMQRLGQSMTNHSNEKYEERGSLFQGAFRSKTIVEDEYLRYVAAYVMVKNTFELYPDGGLRSAIEDFEKAWSWAKDYNFSSLGDYSGVRKGSPILNNNNLLFNIFTPQSFKDYSKDVILGGKWVQGEKVLE